MWKLVAEHAGGVVRRRLPAEGFAAAVAAGTRELEECGIRARDVRRLVVVRVKAPKESNDPLA